YDVGWKPDLDAYGPVPFLQEMAQCVAVSSDGKLLATGSADGSVKVWNLLTGELLCGFVHTIEPTETDKSKSRDEDDDDEDLGGLKPSKSGITFVSFSSEKPAHFVISAAHHPKCIPSIKLWSLKNPSAAPKVMIGGHTLGSQIQRCEFLQPENRRLMSIGSDLNVALWEVARCKTIRVLTASPVDEDVSEAVAVKGASAGAAGATAHRPSISSAVLNRRKRLHPSGWGRISGAVAPNGLFAFGSSSLTVMDLRWKESLVKDLNGQFDKEKIKRHRLTSAVFSSDSATIFVASAVPPDDQQMLAVDLQLKAEKMLAKSEQQSESDPIQAGKDKRPSSAGSLLCINTATTEFESELKKAKQSWIR
ncbi:hypothetical protein HDV05_002023, partial [Chytridiales sp. JEL 0842]